MVGASHPSLEAQPTSTADRASFATPGLFPGFGRDIHDYVVRCDDKPVAVAVRAPAGWRVAVAGGNARTGDYGVSVPLKSGQAFGITIESPAGSTVDDYHVRCLPPSFPKYTFKRFGPVSPKFFSADHDWSGKDSRYGIIFDNYGVPIWWTHSQAQGTRVLPSGNLLWADHASTPYRWEVHSLDGRLLRTLDTVGPPADSHDLQPAGDGTYLAGATVPQHHVDTSAYGGSKDSTVLNTELQQVDRAGHRIWDWKSQNHIALAETGRLWAWAAKDPHDILHWNSIEPDGNAVVASFRHLDAVYKIRKGSGAIAWKLGGTPTAKSLTVRNDPHDYVFGAQHDARVLPDGSLTVFDNRSGLASARPEAVHFRIDPRARTATLLQAVTDPRVATSGCCGSARLLTNGDWLISWGKTGPIGGYGPGGARRFLLTFDTTFSYRATPVPTGVLTAQDLRDGMNAMDRRAAPGRAP